jgi:F-type H+-transporting ATPase subunit delta
VRQTILARRYAKALFAVGREEGTFVEYARTLNDLAALYSQQPVVADGLTNIMYPFEVRAKVMGGLIKALGSDKIMARFLNLLVEKRRTDILPELALEYQAIVDKDQNICRSNVVSATELSKDLQAKVQATLENITGKKVILATEVDPAIIGGIVAKIGDLVLDGSIKTQLAGLNESIKGSE